MSEPGHWPQAKPAAFFAEFSFESGSRMSRNCTKQGQQRAGDQTMTVYVIVQLKMTDRAAYDRYQARFFDVFKKYSGRLLSADEKPAVLEGAWDRDKVVLMSFPDEGAFHAWASSAEYQEILKERKAGAQAVVLLAKGFN
jgi:uncharacterized protein (DUF1330 family)